MRIYVMTDLEGISGVYSREQVTQAGSRFAEGRRYMTADINSCVEGLKAGGADEVYVCDCHGGSYTVLWDEVTSKAEYCISGKMPGKRFWGAEDCDGVVLLGYHAMAGTPGAVLEHSYSSKEIQNVWMNGRAIGEIGFDAAIAGEYGMPVIMVSGDDKACAEAREFLPHVTTACVKKAMSVNGAMLLPPEAAHRLIFEKAREAVENLKNCLLFHFTKPMECRVEVMERIQLCDPAIVPYAKILDGRMYSVTGDSAEELFFRVFNVVR